MATTAVRQMGVVDFKGMSDIHRFGHLSAYHDSQACGNTSAGRTHVRRDTKNYQTT
ncbi:hypothetical protein [Roseovarius aestuarii]|nr:hypothetical protein [Roseovarius aestuarii]